MKKYILTLIVALFATSMAFAQPPSRFVAKSSKIAKATDTQEIPETSEEVVVEEDSQINENDDFIGRIFVSYDTSKLYNLDNSDYDTEMKGFSAGFLYSWNSKKDNTSSLYIDFGYNLSYGRYKEDVGSGDPYKFTFFTMNMPLGLSYRAKLSDDIFLVPHANMNFCIGIDATEDQGGEGYTPTTNYFDKDDVGDDKWSRFQFGYNIGVAFEINNIISLGINYRNNFTELTENYKYQNLSFVFGIIL